MLPLVTHVKCRHDILCFVSYLTARKERWHIHLVQQRNIEYYFFYASSSGNNLIEKQEMLANRTEKAVYDCPPYRQCWLFSVIFTSCFVQQACLGCVYVSDYFPFLFLLHMVSAKYFARLSAWEVIPFFILFLLSLLYNISLFMS